jgi:hypothetical protein
MRLVTRKGLPHIFYTAASCSKTPNCVIGGLAPAPNLSNNLALLEAYFLIPQPSVRRFVLMLVARITDDTDTACPFGGLSEAEYLLTYYARLSTGDMGDKVLALVRQICVANGGDIGGMYETTGKSR